MIDSDLERSDSSMIKTKLFLKKLRFYVAVKEDCDARNNLGVIGVGTAQGEKGVLDAKLELCDLIKHQGGDFFAMPGFVPSIHGTTSYGNGCGYRGWKNFGSQKAALSYLAQYFNLVECEESRESAPEIKEAVGSSKKAFPADACRGSTTPSPQNPVRILAEIGFEDAAQWMIVDERKIYDLGDDAEVWQGLKEPKNALYAFCVGSEVLYVGKTARSLENRFIGYRDPGNTQATNRKCHDEIRRRLNEGETVRIMVMPDQTRLHWGQFRINLAAGLEDALVEKLHPPLNGKNAKQFKTESEQLEEDTQNKSNP